MLKKIKIIGFIASAVLVVFSVSPVFAQYGQQTGAGQTATSGNQAKNQLKSKLTEEKINKVRGSFAKIENRFNVHTRNLDSLAQRIENWVIRASQEGKDVISAQANLNDAKMKIQEAQEAAIKLRTDIDDMIYADNPKEKFGIIKNDMTKNVAEKIKAAHRALVQVIISLKNQYGVLDASSAQTSTTTSGTSTNQ